MKYGDGEKGKKKNKNYRMKINVRVLMAACILFKIYLAPCAVDVYLGGLRHDIILTSVTIFKGLRHRHIFQVTPSKDKY